MPKTAISEKLEAKGLTARIVALDVALALFRNNGGTYAEALDRLNTAFADEGERYSSAGRMLSERAMQVRMGSEAAHEVPRGQLSGASASRTEGDEAGRVRTADEDRTAVARPSPADRERGAGLELPKGRYPIASARDPRKPGHAKRGAAEIAGVQATMARSLFDSYRLPGDDRAIGDVTWKELQGLARRHAEAFRLLSLIDGYGQPADPEAKVRDVLKEGTLREFVEIARLSNVH